MTDPLLLRLDGGEVVPFRNLLIEPVSVEGWGMVGFLCRVGFSLSVLRGYYLPRPVSWEKVPLKTDKKP